MRTWAPGGRIPSREELDDLLAKDAHYNLLESECGLSERHMQRIVQGQHWQNGWLPRQLPNEYKACEVCGETFARRQDNGRLRRPCVWARMVVCSQHCKLKRQWATGAFANRRKN